MDYLLFAAFFTLIAFLVFFDLKVLHKKGNPTNALFWSLFWIALALLFNCAIYFIYEFHTFEGNFLIPKSGKDAATEFFTAYLLEKSLSLDNIFIISMIFSYHNIPLKFQQRVLSIGILTATVLRGIMIFLGLALVDYFSWILYLLGLFLLITGLRLLFFKGEEKKLEEAPFLSRFFPITEKLHDEKFFIKANGIWKMTPLMLALWQIETADLIFAIDSIPAVFAITLDPFIVLTSNIFAIFGLRSLYFALAAMIERFRFLKPCLAIILCFVGFKMVIVDFYHISNLASLAVIVAILAAGVILSIVKK